MTIRDRLTLLFTALAGGLLLVFALTVYGQYARNREEEFFRRLRQQATLKADLLFNAEVAPDVLQLIYRNARHTLYQEEVAIYDTSFALIYHDAVEIDFVKETPEMIRQVQQNGQVQFRQEGRQVTGFLFPHAGTTYVVTAAAYDDYGLGRLRDLRHALAAGTVLAVGLVFLTGRYFARKALEPVANMTERAARISATSLDLRLGTGHEKDELAELAHTFNSMLDRLEASFEAQKTFVLHASHELRTPLSAVTSELELALSRERSPEAYRQAIGHALADSRQLARLVSDLLDMARASYDPQGIHFQPLRIDELLLEAMAQLQRALPGCEVHLDLDGAPDTEQRLTVRSNAHLLQTAFYNLMENGCKFSPHQRVTVRLDADPQHLRLHFADEGPGIPPTERMHVFTYAYRGTNASQVPGNGIGLSLVQQIIELHRGSVRLVETTAPGATFEVLLPHLDGKLS